MIFRNSFAVLSSIVGIATMVTALVSPVVAASTEQCVDFLNRPGVYESGRLSSEYRDALRQSGRAILTDGTVDRTTIMNGCAAGAFDQAFNALGRNAALTGSTSYTKSEAHAALERAGFTSISNLRLDSSGIWRADAIQPSKRVSVAFDYHGIVVDKETP